MALQLVGQEVDGGYNNAHNGTPRQQQARVWFMAGKFEYNAYYYNTPLIVSRRPSSRVGRASRLVERSK